jgi:hypothetical protein
MSRTASVRRPLAVAALGAALVSASFAGVAGAAKTSDPSTLRPGATIPVDFAGYSEPSNDKLPSGYVIVKRTVTMQEGEIHLDGRPITVRLTAPKGYQLVAVGDKGKIRWAASPLRYGGKRAVTLRLTADGHDAGKSTETGTFYALAKRGDTDA